MCVNFTYEKFVGFLEGNILKYTLRYDDKDGAKDIAKIKVYSDWRKEYELTNGISIGTSDGGTKKVYRAGCEPQRDEKKLEQVWVGHQ
jgi:hypothetical protein